MKPAWLKQNLAFSTLWRERSELELGPPPVASLGVVSDCVAGSHPHPLGDRPREYPSGKIDIRHWTLSPTKTSRLYSPIGTYGAYADIWAVFTNIRSLFTNQDTRRFSPISPKREFFSRRVRRYYSNHPCSTFPVGGCIVITASSLPIGRNAYTCSASASSPTLSWSWESCGIPSRRQSGPDNRHRWFNYWNDSFYMSK